MPRYFTSGKNGLTITLEDTDNAYFRVPQYNSRGKCLTYNWLEDRTSDEYMHESGVSNECHTLNKSHPGLITAFYKMPMCDQTTYRETYTKKECIPLSICNYKLKKVMR
ncbi:hypothetical protein GJ496_001320 [Pomphorhynchus laevis]|nr:hypothetical protein GJ496_001320 [Pomphorhynchus laevis]